MTIRKRRLSLKLKQIIIISFLTLITFNSYAQLKINDNVILDAYEYPDIPYLIYYVNLSNSGSNELSKIEDILFVTQSRQEAKNIFPLYISSSLDRIPPKTINVDGIIAFRGNFTDFVIHSSVNNSGLNSDLIEKKDFKNYKEEAYALAVILALENYKAGDTLVNYYYKNYYLSNNPDMIIREDNYLKEYLDAAIIRAANIYENQKEDLSIPEIKEITKNLNESRNKDNNDTLFNKGLRNYYLELARYYSKSEEKDNEIIAGYYGSAMDIEIKGEFFENTELFNYANSLFYLEQDNWAEDRIYHFGNCKKFYETLMNNKFRLCEIYLKLGSIYYMENYETGDFSESKKYFNKVIDNNCKEQTEKAKKNLANIKELEKK
ncbi:MAG: hypothetical protein JW917_08060 [Ignavibacteria bacterium]|nr:hypothetical protein [Ignavibacteria bacterium]